ncbi:hypothetical protein [Sphingomonas sp.]
MKALDWLGRVMLLVLSGFATLSLIGAIAQVADTAADRALSPSPPTVERTGREALSPLEMPPPEQARDPAIGENMAVAPGSQPHADEAVARWLQALVYAVMALAGFVAAGVIVLLRITATLSRIAER